MRRAIQELRDHWAELEAEGVGRGLSLEEAALQAAARLGDEETIAAAMLARPELRSWVHRLPWAAYGIGPVVAFLIAFVATCLVFIGCFESYRAVTGTSLTPHAWLRPYVEGVRLWLLYGLPIATSAAFIWWARRRRAKVLWPVIGVVLVSILGGATLISLSWPQPPHEPGRLEVSLALSPPFPHLAALYVRALSSMLLTLAPWFFVRRRKDQSDGVATWT